MRAPATGLLAGLLFLALAGCLGGATGHDNQRAPSSPQAAGVTTSKVGGKVLVTPAGHRINEFWIARDPADPMRLVANTMDGDDPSGGSVCTVMLSEDGARSWKEITPVDFHTVLGQADPWVTIDPKGAIHATCMEWGGNATGGTRMLYARSNDSGKTWTDPITLPGYDREIIVADRDGVLHYCATLEGGAAVFSSSDGGTTWSAGGRVPGCHSFAQAPDGALLLGTGGQVIRSTNGGLNWSEPQWHFSPHVFYQDGCQGVEQMAPAAVLWCWVALAFSPTHPFPTWSFAVSPLTGNIYVAFQNLTQQRNTLGQPLYHVELYESKDGGMSYGRLPVPPQADNCPACHSSRPLLHIDDAGRVGLVWRQGEDAISWQTWFAASADDARSWSHPLLLGETNKAENELSPGNLLPKDPGAIVAPVVAWAERPDVSDAGQQRLEGGGTEPTWGTRYEGGHYASMSSTPEGFLACWNDLAGGVPQVWCQTVRVAGGA